MRTVKHEAMMAGLIREIIRLDCQSLPMKFESTAGSALSKPRPTRIASVATIRALLVTFGNLNMSLSAICKVTDILEYYEFRRPLTERVLPECLFAFEYCRQTLSLKGATQSPIAAKLANQANEVCDHVELIRERISLAMEYHELKNLVLGDIQQFALKDQFSEADVGPLMFSLTISLPQRLEAFAQTASTHFPNAVAQLYKVTSDVTEQAKRRSRAVEKSAQISKAAPSTPKPLKAESPVRPRLRPLRGVKFRQPLVSTHKRIPSLQEAELARALNASTVDKENFATPQKGVRHRNSSASSSLSHAQPLRALPPLNPQSQRKLNGPVTSSPGRNERRASTRLKQPTRVENRRLAQPVSGVPQLRETPSTRSLHSRVSRPTLIEPRKSSLHLRSDSMSSGTGSARRWSHSSMDSSLGSDSILTSGQNTSYMALSSPETSLVMETPLARKSYVPLRERQSLLNENIRVPRTRRTASAVGSRF